MKVDASFELFGSAGAGDPETVLTDTHGMLSPTRLNETLHDGGTLRVRGAERINPQISSFLSACSQFFGAEVHSNAYYTVGPFAGLDAHYDPFHVFVLQLDGDKLWRLGPKVVHNPTVDFMPLPASKPQMTEELTLSKGHVLYLPPGKWHRPETEKFSLHITIGIRPPRVVDELLEKVREAAQRYPVLRSSYNMEFNGERCTYSFSLEERQAAFDFLASETKPTPPPKDMLEADKPEEIDTIAREIFDTHSYSRCLLLRGSMTRQIHAHTPWDTDLILIVNKEDLAYDSEEHANDLSRRYPSVPRIDLTVVSLANLFDPEAPRLLRLLIGLQSRRLLGDVIDLESCMPALDRETGIRVAREIHEFLMEFRSSFNAGSPRFPNLSTAHFSLFCRSLAKGIFRFATGIILCEKGQFQRDVSDCSQYLRQHRLLDEEDFVNLNQVLSGDHVPINTFLCSADRALERQGQALEDLQKCMK